MHAFLARFLNSPSSREHSRRRAPARHIKFHFSRSCERDDASLRTTFATTSASSRSSAARSAAQQLELHISRSGERGSKFNHPGRCKPARSIKFHFSRSGEQGYGSMFSVLHKQLCNFNSKVRVPTSGVTRQSISLKFVETFRRAVSGTHFNYFSVPLRVFARVEFNSSNVMFNTALLLEFQVQKYCRSQLRRINTPYQLKTSTFYFN
ncbi:hypothetical protein C8R43DRAFT_959876 [Mycena crocata]|nr:hypothetical protein C8R43DRAFT_959876 [Mycena crocata]